MLEDVAGVVPLPFGRLVLAGGDPPVGFSDLKLVARHPFDSVLAEIDGDRTPVACFYCGERFPFRECRLFIVEIEEQDEYMFLCDACHEERVREPFRKMADERGFTEKAWAKLQELAQSDDPQVGAEARASLIRYTALEKGAPPSPESN